LSSGPIQELDEKNESIHFLFTLARVRRSQLDADACVRILGALCAHQRRMYMTAASV